MRAWRAYLARRNRRRHFCRPLLLEIKQIAGSLGRGMQTHRERIYTKSKTLPGHFQVLPQNRLSSLSPYSNHVRTSPSHPLHWNQRVPRLLGEGSYAHNATWRIRFAGRGRSQPARPGTGAGDCARCRFAPACPQGVPRYPHRRADGPSLQWIASRSAAAPAGNLDDPQVERKNDHRRGSAPRTSLRASPLRLPQRNCVRRGRQSQR